MTEHEMDDLVHDGNAWEALERIVGNSPCDLDYPPDIAERVDRMWEEGGDELGAAIIGDVEVERPDRCGGCPDGRCEGSPEAGA